MITWFKFLWGCLFAVTPFLPSTPKVTFLLSLIYTNEYLKNRWQAQQGTTPYGTQQQVVVSRWYSMSGTRWIGPDGCRRMGRDTMDGARDADASRALTWYVFLLTLLFSVLWLLVIDCFLSDYGRQRTTPIDITHHHPDGEWGSRQWGSLTVDGAQGSTDGARDTDASRAPTWYTFLNYFLFLVLLTDYLLSDYYGRQQITSTYTHQHSEGKQGSRRQIGLNE